MELKVKIAIGSVAVLSAFAAGRFTVPERVKIETKIVEVEKKVENKQTDTVHQIHKKTTITKTTKPDGETQTTIVRTDDSGTESKTVDKKLDDIQKLSDTTKEVVRGDSKVTISALGGLSIRTGQPVFGASLTKPVLGPLTIGLWGLSDASCGLSVGFSF